MSSIAKRVISSPLTIFRAIRRSRIDNFVGGIIFGAVFSLLVNILTVGIQEAVSKQRVLEAIEWEIYNNSAEAMNVITNAGEIFKKKEKPSPFYSSPTYSDDLWTQSTEPLQYVAQLPSNTQAEIVVYYNVVLRQSNRITEKSNAYYGENLQDCYYLEGSPDDDPETELKCQKLYYSLVRGDLETASGVFKKSHQVLNVFHPTQDRLNNWFLRLMMGGDSVRVLSGK